MAGLSGNVGSHFQSKFMDSLESKTQRQDRGKSSTTPLFHHLYPARGAFRYLKVKTSFTYNILHKLEMLKKVRHQSNPLKESFTSQLMKLVSHAPDGSERIGIPPADLHAG